MFALLSRVFGSILIGLCLSTFTLLLMTLFISIRNLPTIIENIQRLLRSFLRGSFRMYNAFFSPIRLRLFQDTGFDLYHPVPRVICSIAFSLLIGAGLLIIFSQPILNWELIILAIHGLVVGLAWEGVLRSEDFQMGVNLE